MTDFLIIRNKCDRATEYTNWIGEGMKAFLEAKGHSVVDLSDADASPEKVDQWLKFEDKKTKKAVIALDHGSVSKFYGEKNSDIAAVINLSNAEQLTKMLHVYTLACSTNANNGLGETAIARGCFSWLGYTEPVYAMKSQSFKDCIWSYVEAMTEGKTMEQCQQALYDAYAARKDQSFVYQYNQDRLLLRKHCCNMTINSHNREILSQKIGMQACNHSYVCAERGGLEPLIANRQWIQGWETFIMVHLGNQMVALQGCNGKYVCAEEAGSKPLIANRDQIRSWERFKYIDLGNGMFALAACNGKYVCAENYGKLPLIANRTKIDKWETFVLCPIE